MTNEKNESVKELFHELLNDEDELVVMDLIIDGKEPEEILRFFINKWK